MPPAASAASPALPKYWEKLVLASYHRLLGSTQAQAGAAVGRSQRTIRSWEAVLDNAGTDVDLALKLLERLDPDLAPPTQRHKVHHDVGEGLSGLLKAFGGHDADVG